VRCQFEWLGSTSRIYKAPQVLWSNCTQPWILMENQSQHRTTSKQRNPAAIGWADIIREEVERHG